MRRCRALGTGIVEECTSLAPEIGTIHKWLLVVHLLMASNNAVIPCPLGGPKFHQRSLQKDRPLCLKSLGDPIET